MKDGGIEKKRWMNLLTVIRVAPNYRVVAPPKPQKTYEDYLVAIYRVYQAL